jgi:hypothetical protein
MEPEPRRGSGYRRCTVIGTVTAESIRRLDVHLVGDELHAPMLAVS